MGVEEDLREALERLKAEHGKEIEIDTDEIVSKLESAYILAEQGLPTTGWLIGEIKDKIYIEDVVFEHEEDKIDDLLAKGFEVVGSVECKPPEAVSPEIAPQEAEAGVEEKEVEMYTAEEKAEINKLISLVNSYLPYHAGGRLLDIARKIGEMITKSKIGDVLADTFYDMLKYRMRETSDIKELASLVAFAYDPSQSIWRTGQKIQDREDIRQQIIKDIQRLELPSSIDEFTLQQKNDLGFLWYLISGEALYENPGEVLKRLQGLK